MPDNKIVIGVYFDHLGIMMTHVVIFSYLHMASSKLNLS